MQPLVFIIIPVYNREFSLERCVNSVLEQTFSNWKLMLVDDNSTDATPDIIRRLQDADPRIVSKRNTEFSHSAAGARLSGLLDVDCPYVAFLDSDDEWPNYHLSELLATLEENPDIDYIFGDIRRIDTRGNIIVASKFRDEKGLPASIHIDWKGRTGIIDDDRLLLKAIRDRFVPGLHTSVFRAGLFRRVSLDDSIRVGEDFLFALETIQAGMTIAVSANTHLYYTIHEDNISNAGDADMAHAESNCLDEITLLRDILPQKLTLDRQQRKAVRHRLADMYVWHLGNAIYRPHGHRLRAAGSILQGLRLRPFNLRYWKTLLGTLLWQA